MCCNEARLSEFPKGLNDECSLFMLGILSSVQMYDEQKPNCLSALKPLWCSVQLKLKTRSVIFIFIFIFFGGLVGWWWREIFSRLFLCDELTI